MLSKSLRLVPMISKSITMNTPAAAGFAKTITRHDHHGPPSNYRYPTLDDLPVPCGSWQENYDNNQRKYNIHLLLGTGLFIITMAVGKYSHALDLYMFPPDRPSPRIP